MSKLDVTVVKNPYNCQPTMTCKVQNYTGSSSTKILAGEPVKLSAEGGNYVVKLATGDPEIGTDIVFGIAASDDTATATKDGEVEVLLPLPGIIYRCKAHTPANLSEGIRYDCVTFDLTAGVYTINEDEGSDENVHGLRIVDFDTVNGTVDFEIKGNVTRYGDLV
ncbi:MAG: hypothetical protein XE08_0225 [Parcubacteria bacterium 32_520]|nr:MAG: hypothetical protein XE08_0225 [Parcubacteria bacterium 32_520]